MESFKVSSVSCLQSAWSPNCPGSTWPTRCESRSKICSTGSMGRHWASSTPSKCLTRGSRTTLTRSSSRAFPPASPSGSPAPSAPRTWRGSWRSLTKSVLPSPGRNLVTYFLSFPVTLRCSNSCLINAKSMTHHDVSAARYKVGHPSHRILPQIFTMTHNAPL